MAGKTTTEPANYLRAWREEFELSQVELAKKMGQHSSTISELESGKKQLSDKWLRQIGAALGLEPGLLLFDPHDANMEIVRDGLKVAPDQKKRVIEVLRAFRVVT